VENRAPSWLAEITGHGAHVGFFTQAGHLIGSLEDDTTSATANNVIASISGGNKVLQLGGSGVSNGTAVSELDMLNYEKYNASHKTTYTASNGGALWYLGYEKPELFNAYLTMLSEGNVNSKLTDVAAGGKTNDGFAGVVDFMVSPLGQITDEENPLTFKLTGNAITGFNFESVTENLGFGLKADGGFYLGTDNFVLSPTLAFDGKLDVNNEFTWKMGGGFIFQFSGMRWITSGDDWNDLDTLGNQDFRYENSKVLKYAYAQAYAAYSEATDVELIVIFQSDNTKPRPPKRMNEWSYPATLSDL
jgi:hypothetical protein